MQQVKDEKKAAEKLKNDIASGREKLKTAKDFPGTHRAIAKPNFQYFRQLFPDAYVCGSEARLSGMIFENSMRKNEDHLQHDSWIKINGMLPRIHKSMAVSCRFQAMLLKMIDVNKHSTIVNVLSKPIQRSLV